MSDCGLWSALKSLFRCFPPFRSTENAHRSPVVSPTLRSARCSGRGKKAGRNFLFSFLPWSFVYLFNRIYMSILDSPPPSGCSDRVGWHTSHPTSLKGESTWRGGGTVQKNSYPLCAKGLIYKRDCGLCATACRVCALHRFARTTACRVRADEGEAFLGR